MLRRAKLSEEEQEDDGVPTGAGGRSQGVRGRASGDVRLPREIQVRSPCITTSMYERENHLAVHGNLVRLSEPRLV